MGIHHPLKVFCLAIIVELILSRDDMHRNLVVRADLFADGIQELHAVALLVEHPKIGGNHRDSADTPEMSENGPKIGV